YKICLPCFLCCLELFYMHNLFGKILNLLPYDGEVNYLGQVFSKSEADSYLEQLLSNIEWQNDQAILFGKQIVTKRKVAWYGDQPFKYTYSGVTKVANL